MHGASYTGATFVASGGPWYLPLAGNFPGLNSGAGQCGFATEEWANVTIQRKCILSDLNIVTKTLGASTTATVRLRKNAGYGNTIVTLNASNTGFHDTTHTDVLVPGDKACWEVLVTGANTVAFDTSSHLMQPIIKYGELPSWLTILPSDASPPTVPNNTTAFGTAFGTGTTGSTSESPWQVTARDYFRLGLAEGYITENTLENTYLSTLRKNGGNGISQLSIAAGLTGRFLDGRIDEYFAGDTYDFSAIVPAGTGGTHLKGSLGSFYGFGYFREYAVFLRTALNFNQSKMMPIEGEAHAANVSSVAAAALSAQSALSNYRFSNLRVRPITNSLETGKNATLTFAVSGVDSTLTVTIPGGSLAIVEDSSHSVDVVASNFLNHHIVTTSPTNGAITAFITMMGRPLVS